MRASGYPTMLDFFFDMRRVAFNCVWFNYGSAAHFLCKAVQTVSKSFFDMLCTFSLPRQYCLKSIHVCAQYGFEMSFSHALFTFRTIFYLPSTRTIYLS